MPILKVANVYFNQSGSSRIQYNNDNVVRLIANSFDLPSGTSTNRPTGTSLDVGQIRYNTDITAFEFYTTAGWENVATQTVVTAAFTQANTAANGNVVIRTYTSTTPATWTKPSGIKGIRVIVVGGGGGSGITSPTQGGAAGAGGGAAVRFLSAPSIPGPITVTVGAGGIGKFFSGPGTTITATSGGTSSFGALASATGGAHGDIATIYNPISGAPAASQGAEATGGTGTSGDFNIPGRGALSSQLDSGFLDIQGGSSALEFGHGGYGATGGTVPAPQLPSGTVVVTAQPGYGYGGGGGLAGKNAPYVSPQPANHRSLGGNGTSGIVIVEEYY